NRELKFILIENLDFSIVNKELKKKKKHFWGNIILSNNNGHYIFHPDRNKLYGFELAERQGYTFENEFGFFPDIFPKSKFKVIKNDKGIFIGINFDFFPKGKSINSFSKLEIANPKEQNRYLISFISKKKLNELTSKLATYYLIFLFISGLIIGILVYLFIERKDRQIAYIKKIETLLENLKQHQENIKLTNKNLRKKNDQLKEFNQIISHNLRAPIVNLNLLIGMADEKAPSEYINKMQMIITSLDNLIEDLLHTVRIINTSNLPVEDVSIAKSIEKVKELLSENIIRTDTEIILENDSWDLVKFNRNYLENIFFNLINNSIKYQSPSRKLIITIQTMLENNEKVLIISDNGVGLDLKKHKKNLFKLYKTFHREKSGKGLGLFMVKNQIESMGGEISISNNNPEGLTFKIKFTNNHIF
ncbi:MAG: HAMP domain-containing histidine kinase, partial [Leptospiraceae bacterium]|nr:HAMP domain-containing histidine kinase [Leptospiraceae bacterium]